MAAASIAHLEGTERRALATRLWLFGSLCKDVRNLAVGLGDAINYEYDEIDLDAFLKVLDAFDKEAAALRESFSGATTEGGK